jgi:excisionase family DNA binding protein
MEKHTFTISETAEMLGIAKNTVYRAVRRGEIPIIRVGGRLLVARAAMIRLLEGHMVSGIGEIQDNKAEEYTIQQTLEGAVGST